MVKKTAVIFGLAALLLASVFTTPVAAADSYPLLVTDSEIANALDYLIGEQNTDGSIGSFVDSAWVTMAIAAVGEDPHDWQTDGNSIVDYLATNSGSASSSTDYSRMILAIVAAGEDPFNFGGRDFISLLEGTYDGSQMGEETLINDDAFGIMALVSAGYDTGPSVISDAVDYILTNQNTEDGGWGFNVGGDSDVDMTAACTMALIAAGESETYSAIIDALGYIESTQADNGGFLSWGSTNADTDSWGISAIAAVGEDPDGSGWTSGNGNSPVDDLLTYQQTSGAFYFQDGLPGAWPVQTTAKAIIALLGKYYPVVSLDIEGETVDIRIEGQSTTIWSGTVTVDESDITATNSGQTYHLANSTALGALDEASQDGDFSYETSDEYGSLFITSIAGEAGSATNAWLYRVDSVSATVGAGEFVINDTAPPSPPHQEILFYYVVDGNWGAQPLKIEVDNVEPETGEQFTVTVSEYSDDTSAWSPSEGATVYAGHSYTTGPDGTVDITVDTDITLEIYAEKDSYIRSNRISVTVGTGSSSTSQLGLEAEIMPAISLNINPSSIDFGTLGPRDISLPQTVTATNTGAWQILVTCTISDEANGLYIEGITLDEIPWDDFSDTIGRGGSRDYDVTLTVSENYSGVGAQTGTIIFWAEDGTY
ncbi:MAG: prenyltransferase/squalene oxidase repeat-containing protein [Dehalococcoidales bacterium]|nr:prenyltransferase/squalene oxidase repeat-containing protein [Dehalococcoidales bacterium]